MGKHLVFDLDNIWQALTGNERYKKVDVLKTKNINKYQTI